MVSVMSASAIGVGVGAQRLDLDLEAGIGRGEHAEAAWPRSGSTQCSQLRGVTQRPWTRTIVSGRSCHDGRFLSVRSR